MSMSSLALVNQRHARPILLERIEMDKAQLGAVRLLGIQLPI
jgi:hypothetical protein